ncbi:AAA domain-containing protein [Campylobacter sp. MG1]|uniref:AAA domain-containing protein n=1 Tax=Campylobacter sp. MG1 TaxID=2976332 RepID=UPI00226D0A77|nr:AAA domain-containing protein [Campylobacter sp. MG1]
MEEIYGYLIKENLGDNKLLVSKNSSDFFAYILEKNENNPHIGSLAYELCNIECDGLIKCEFYEDKNNYYFITDLYETINNTFLEDYAIRNYVLTRQNLIKFLNVFIKLESLGLDYFMSNKIYIKEGRLYLDFLCNKFLNNNVYENNLEVFKVISKKYFSINTDIYKDFYEVKEDLLKQNSTFIKKYEINFSKKVIDSYKDFMDKQNKCIMEYKLLHNLQSYINKNKPYFLLSIDKQNREEIKIALGEYVFCCSTKNNNYLYCFNIMFDNQVKLDEVYKKGLFKSSVEFIATIDTEHLHSNFTLLDSLYNELQNHNSNSGIKSSVKSIKMEEDLLKAENEFIQSKKLTQIGTIDSISNNKVCFLIDDFEKHFKQNQKVIIKKLNNSQNDDEIKGVVEKFKSSKGLLDINLEDEYQGINLKKIDKNQVPIKYSINYDYQAEEIVFKKKERALDELKKSNVYINNLANKLCDPDISFKQSEIIQIDRFFNKDLDENQQLAVKKALSLQDGSEILLIQGPPGTGKTTTIVEILKHYLKLHPNYKMLITSQSNQAVDNVLEKICKDEPKILRIGNDENKMSEIARSFTPNKVINALVNKNLKDLKENKLEGYENYQANFEQTLQTITSKSVKNTDTEKFFIKNIKLIFGTLIGISSWSNFREIVFDLVIVDEAGRATLSELLVPCIKARKIIFVGDHKQLAPIIDDDVANNLEEYSKEEVVTSLFEQIYESNTKFPNLKHRLTYNYRAHESICNLYSNVFYEGELKTKKELNELKQHNIPFYKTNAIWLNTSRLKDRADEQKGTGKINRCNAKVILKELEDLLEHCKQNNLSIGIITPYKDQKHYLDISLKNIVKAFKDEKLEIDIGTVDSFQGSDRDIIIYDCVRSGDGKKSKIDFIADEKRLNVSLSRSKKLLLIVGDIEFLYKSSTNKGINPFKEIIEYMDKNNYEIRTLGERI